ncbi:U-box domain-containing protein 25 [Acorus calamus]|uniref:U-box domain-containing protein n=1 Tax=Acorus calamus TaxID=4465 RepID=A0AAV9DEH1_ACOCL|nr:U-box domain-containing protein 25 [Acorus calamus]
MPISSRKPADLSRLVPQAVHVPHHFRCPISLDLMRDPVTVATGQTYDRSSIESWFGTGNSTCPVTNSTLRDFSLTPNHNLRRLIQDWCVSHRSLGVERIPTPKQPADPASVSVLLSQAPSSAPALRALRALARESDKNRATMSARGAQRVLVEILFRGARESALEALALLACLPGMGEPECASVVESPQRLALLSELLNGHDSLDVRVDAAALLEMVSSGARSAEQRALIGSTDGVFEGLVAVLKDPSLRCPRSLKAAVKALFSLCLVKQNRARAARAGAAEAVVERVADLERGDAERALATLELLFRARAHIEGARAARTLVKAMMKVSGRATEHATGALLSMCAASESAQEEAVAAGVVTQLLLVVQSDCTGRAKRKAQALLKLLRRAWPDNDSFANSDDFAPTGLVMEFGPF